MCRSSVLGFDISKVVWWVFYGVHMDMCISFQVLTPFIYRPVDIITIVYPDYKNSKAKVMVSYGWVFFCLGAFFKEQIKS